MKTKSWIFILVGVMAFGLVLSLGAAGGAALTYFFLRADSISPALAASAEINPEAGILIASVAQGSAAADAGLVRGDILQQVNGLAVDTLPELQALLTDLAPGDSVALTVLHGDELRNLSATLGDRQGQAFLGVSACGGPLAGTMMFDALPGEGWPGMIKLSTGVQVVEVIADSPAEKAGLAAGDLILSVDGEELGPDAELADLIQAHAPGDSLALSVQSARDQRPRQVPVTLGENPEVPGQAYLGIKYTAGFHNLSIPGMPCQMPLEEGMRFERFDEELPFHRFDFGAQPLPEGFEKAAVIGKVLPGTPAEAADLQVGDAVLAVNGEPLESFDTLSKVVSSHQPGDQISLTILRAGEQLEFEITLAGHPDDPDQGYLGVLVTGFLSTETIETPGVPDSFEEDELEFPGVPGGDA
jgi:S1-C subfamily serine protease